MKKYLSALAALALLFACTPEKTPGGDNKNNGGNSQPTVVELTGIALTEHEITLEKGGNKVLEVKFTPANASNKSVTWVSSNTSVATVTDGVVVGVAPGSTEIIAKSGNFTDKCQVTVVISAKGISLNKTELAFKALNETETLVATLDPESSTGKIEWGSSDANVASVSPEGVVTSVAPGTAEITASCGSVFAKCAVTVEVAATSLSLDKNSLNLFIGDTETITATVLPENTTDQLTWSSSDEAIATVQDGVVTAVAEGEATITAKAGEKTADCVVTVALPASDANAIVVRYYGCRALGNHTDINIYADNQLVAADGFGIATLKKNWSSATAVVSGVEYNLEATDGASFSNHQYGNYYWTWAFKDSYVEAALKNASNEPVTIIMTDVNGGKYYLIYKENQSSSYSYYRYEHGSEEAPIAVDLGLSVKWATCNLGAAKPEDYGDYYAWGETVPKDNYNWSTYKWGTSSTSLTKYNTDSSRGTVDNKTVLEPDDDAAHAALGGKWRMPTDAEWTELRTKCTWTWVTNYNGSGINGKLVTATNGNSIFLPAAGYRGGTSLYYAGSDGYYWSSSLNTDYPDDAWGVYFFSDDVFRYNFYRYSGQSVRPVTE